MTDSKPDDVERQTTPSSSRVAAHRPAGENGSPTGPVADPESPLSAEWRQTLCDELYLQTDGEVAEDVAITEREVETFLEVLSLEVGFRTGDARSLPCEAGTYDAVLLVGSSFGEFADEEDDRRVLEEACRRYRSRFTAARTRDGGTGRGVHGSL